ncbi:putative bifunctional diguanylate cyclase/phosphodiesterase [Rhizobium paknamense]|uniref:Diguanylate cyclase (GGDEF)-like protein n=1 Tax=Rhizobium paknamense TaxID=1206817 RepID=A0ABU0IBD9_9HYPH|nr:bifunctional diguanylate cyclase/phosphodiesterase [Rhizobium paknamense]MDQ0454569.1 diguanylate cyclase (GGDEF)-like protein [Rhizobium paknamense]
MTDDDKQARIERLTRRLERERRARQEAEALLEERARELYLANTELAHLASALEKRVEERTQELVMERERAMALAQQDQLTGIANRRSFTSFLSAACRKAWAHNGRVSVFLLDVDDFKRINDVSGHEAGDAALTEVARRLTPFSGTGQVARLGGDEFALLRHDLKDDAADAKLAAQLVECLKVPFVFGSRTLDISASLGHACLPDQANSSAELLRHADMALFASKKLGRGAATAFSDELRDEAEERRILELELVLALDRGEILPWYQPIVESISGQAKGVEVLARWHHPLRGVVLPSLFLPLAEDRRLLGPLFTQILQRACTELGPLIKAGRLSYVSVNVSPSQFRSGGLSALIQVVLEQTGFPPHALVVEITEDMIMADMSRAARELDELARLGVRVALDDFGTGYSNIASLSRLPINWLKLDRSLIASISNGHVEQAIVRAVLDMARALKIDVVAEGIETAAQAAWLTKAGCMRHQGFYYGRPAPLAVLQSSLADEPPARTGKA